MNNNYRATSLKVGSLLLDPKNTRIPTDRRSDKQRSLLHVLLAHEDVRGLAASIAKLDLFPNERLVVISEGGRFVVLPQFNFNLRYSVTTARKGVELLIHPSSLLIPDESKRCLPAVA